MFLCPRPVHNQLLDVSPCVPATELAQNLQHSIHCRVSLLASMGRSIRLHAGQCDVTASVTDGTHTDRAAHHASACTCHNIVQSTYLLSQRHNYSLTLDSRGIGLWGSLHDGEKPGMPLSRSIKFDFSAFFWCHHKQNKYNNPFLKILRYVVPQRM